MTAVTLLFALGMVMIFNTSSAEVLDHDLELSTHHALIRHIFSAFFGCAIAGLAWFLGYRTLLKLSYPLLAFVTFLLLLVFVPGIGVTANGAHRWIRLGPYTMQPSELAKFLIPAAFLQTLLQRGRQELELLDFLKVLGALALPIGLILLEPDNGTVAIIGATLVVMFFLTGIRASYWVLPMLLFVAVAGVAAMNTTYVSSRLKVYLNPELDVRGRGHQPLQAKIAVGSGGLMGRGPGKSLQKLSYLPEAQNDYIAAIYGEEFGYTGILALILLYMTIAYLGFHIALQSADRAGFMVAGMITFLIALQAFLNLGVVSGLLPSTGLNLPFFSQGGTSLLANIVGIGVLLNVAYAAERHSVAGCLLSKND